jgi:23S rRNA pseudouridine1911/1915/1917 synthase
MILSRRLPAPALSRYSPPALLRYTFGRNMAQETRFQIGTTLQGLALASAMKRLLSDRSWSQVKRLIATRRVTVNDLLATDPTAPVRGGDRIAIFARSRPKPVNERDVRIVHLDEQLLVVDKPPRIIAVRRPEEMDWPEQRKAQQPTLDELLQRIIATRPDAPRGAVVRSVHRLDRDTSGLMIFALSSDAAEALGRLFHSHAIERNYLAIVHGSPPPQRIESWFVRDRGDGLRGSALRGRLDPHARRAVTHVEPLEQIGPVSLIRCRLETGRTHQIRIHLMERDHMICGDRIYTHRLGESPRIEFNRAPRQALHSAELRFVHPFSNEPLTFQSPLPPDLATWLERVRKQECGGAS